MTGPDPFNQVKMRRLRPPLRQWRQLRFWWHIKVAHREAHRIGDPNAIPIVDCPPAYRLFDQMDWRDSYGQTIA